MDNNSQEKNELNKDVTNKAPDVTNKAPDVTNKAPDVTKKAPDVTNKAPDMKQASTQQTGGGMSFWGFANTFATTISQQTQDVIKTVQQTDWNKEIQNFQKELTKDSDGLRKEVQKLPEQARSSVPMFQQQGDQLSKQLGTYWSAFTKAGSEFVHSSRDALESMIQNLDEEFRKAALDDNHTSQPRAKSLEHEIAALQRDSSTFCSEPEEQEQFQAWLKDFDINMRKKEIADILTNVQFMNELQSRIIPLLVDYETFWTRYFFRLDQLKQKYKDRLQQAVQQQQQYQQQQQQQQQMQKPQQQQQQELPEGISKIQNQYNQKTQQNKDSSNGEDSAQKTLPSTSQNNKQQIQNASSKSNQLSEQDKAEDRQAKAKATQQQQYQQQQQQDKEALAYQQEVAKQSKEINNLESGHQQLNQEEDDDDDDDDDIDLDGLDDQDIDYNENDSEGDL